MPETKITDSTHDPKFCVLCRSGEHKWPPAEPARCLDRRVPPVGDRLPAGLITLCSLPPGHAGYHYEAFSDLNWPNSHAEASSEH